MTTELKFDKIIARQLLKIAPKMKPKGISRAYKPGQSFQIGDDAPSGPNDYIVLTPDGEVGVLAGDFWVVSI